MKANPGNPDVNEWACYAIAKLAFENAGSQAAIAAAGGIMVCWLYHYTTLLTPAGLLCQTPIFH